MATACDNEFNTEEMQILYNLIVMIVSYRSGQNKQIDIYDELKWRTSTTKITNRIGYRKRSIETNSSVNRMFEISLLDIFASF